MTHRIYEYEGGVYSFNATVTDCAEQDGMYRLTLDKTAFFPGGGGQSADEGEINGERTVRLCEENGEIYHYLASPIAVGTVVTGSVDRQLRFMRMQAHTGEHIVSGTVHRLFGYDNVGFHMESLKNGENDVTVDFNGTFTDEEFALAEYEADKAVFADLPVTVAFPSAEELACIPYRSKKELTGRVRIVTIANTDICACCAPHLASTGQVGLIKLLDRINWKGGTRLHIRCGEAALKDYNEKYLNNKAVAEALAVKQSETGRAFAAFASETANLKKEMSELRKKYVTLRAQAVSRTEGNLCLFEDDVTVDELRLYINLCVKKCGGICAGFSGSDNGYVYVIESEKYPLRALSKEINAAIAGKGGGSDSMMTGRSAATREEIERFFMTYKN